MRTSRRSRRFPIRNHLRIRGGLFAQLRPHLSPSRDSNGSDGGGECLEEFATQKKLQDYAERIGNHLWEGTPAFAKRQQLLSPDQYEIVDVRTSRGVRRAMLFPKAILQAEF